MSIGTRNLLKVSAERCPQHRGGTAPKRAAPPGPDQLHGLRRWACGSTLRACPTTGPPLAARQPSWGVGAAPADRARASSPAILLTALATLALLAGLQPSAAASAGRLPTPGPAGSQGPAVLSPDDNDPGQDGLPSITPSAPLTPATSSPNQSGATEFPQKPLTSGPGTDRVQPAPTASASPQPRPSRTPSVPSLVGLTVSDARRALARAGLPIVGLARLPGEARITAQRGSPEGDVVVEIGRAPNMGLVAPGQAAEPSDAPQATQTRPVAPAALPPVVRKTVEQLLDECRELDRYLAKALLLVDQRREMRVRDAATVPVAVTLDVDGPARRLTTTAGGKGVDVIVSCRLRARLQGPAADFHIEPGGWDEQSLLTKRTAEWSWFVTPLRRGTADLQLLLEPLVIVDDRQGDDATVLVGARSTTEMVPISVEVSAPLDVVLVEWLDRIEKFLKSLQGALVTSAAVAAAAIALWAVVRRRRSPGGAGGGAAAPPVP